MHIVRHHGSDPASHSPDARRLQPLAAAAAPTAGTDTAVPSCRSGASRELFIAPTRRPSPSTPRGWRRSYGGNGRRGALLQERREPRAFHRTHPTPIAFNPSRLAPLLRQERTPRRPPVGAAPAASFSSHPPDARRLQPLAAGAAYMDASRFGKRSLHLAIKDLAAVLYPACCADPMSAGPDGIRWGRPHLLRVLEGQAARQACFPTVRPISPSCSLQPAQPWTINAKFLCSSSVQLKRTRAPAHAARNTARGRATPRWCVPSCWPGRQRRR